MSKKSRSEDKKEEIKHVKNSKSPGPDEIYNKNQSNKRFSTTTWKL